MPKTATVVQSRADMVSGGVDGQDGFSMTPCSRVADVNQKTIPYHVITAKHIKQTVILVVFLITR